MTTALLLAALALASTPAQDGSESIDSRWTPWLGCWELVDDQRREPLVGEADPTQGQDVPLRGTACLNPAPGRNGVTVTTVAGGEAFLEETLIANGEKNPSAKGSCTGWQQTEWSSDGHRLFSNAELTCEDNRSLKVSGLSMMVPRSTWVDVQIVESTAGRAVVIRRYRPANDTHDPADNVVSIVERDNRRYRSQVLISEPLSADDIVEAANKVAPEALEAAVLEHEQGFALDAETLLELDDADVRPGLIDLMVALSYPEQFTVDSPSADSSGGGFALPGGYYGSSMPYGYRTPYHVTPFSYYYWYASPHPRYVVAPVSVREVRQGIVSSRGYSQVKPRATGRRAGRRSGSGGSAVSGSSSSSGGSSGTASGRGYTRGGSSGRTATKKR